MGNLLKVLTREIENYPHFFLDFENAQPTEGEREIWNQISAVLQDSESILADLQAYKGAGPEIRDAIQNPNDIQLQEKAWNAVCPLVVRLKRFYEFSIRLEKALQSLLESLTCPPYTPTQHLEREQALAKEFAEILHFTLRFDELKMRNPAIQNDFSYYRRTISRNRINNMHLDIENEVNNEMANRMSLFYAEATPMLKTLSNATMHFVSENKTLPIENTTDCLSTMTSVCKVMLETPEYRSRFTSEETLMFCMRVMVGVIILYDHVHPVGAFCKTSKIDMKGCIKVLKEQAPDSVEGLLNALSSLDDLHTQPPELRTLIYPVSMPTHLAAMAHVSFSLMTVDVQAASLPRIHVLHILQRRDYFLAITHLQEIVESYYDVNHSNAGLQSGRFMVLAVLFIFDFSEFHSMLCMQ
uniref:CYFIP related Rac1 interactor A n=1 Tax=Canis lupus familiaris TaxID=9615 RepID=A0A8C0RIV8_CANLF